MSRAFRARAVWCSTCDDSVNSCARELTPLRYPQRPRSTHATGIGIVAFAGASVAAQLAGASALSLLLTGLAAVFATGALWFTIGKVADITQESRTRATWWAIAALTPAAASAYLAGVYLLHAGRPAAFVLLRTGVVLLTLTFGFARYGVHCYKTQTSIGAGFRSDPDEQYWATAQ